VELEVTSLDEKTVDSTLNLLLKDKEDQDNFRKQLGAKGLIAAVNE